MIRVEDYDQPPLEPSDFINLNGSADMVAHSMFCMLQSELCEYILEIVNSNAPRSTDSTHDSLEQRLAGFATRLPLVQDFSSLDLTITFNLAVLIHRRTKRVDGRSLLCRDAASTILITFETMMAENLLRQCSVHAETAYLAASIQFAQDVKASIAINSVMQAQSANGQLKRLLRCMHKSAEYWPHIHALHNLCENLRCRCSRLIEESVTHTRQQLQPQPCSGLDIPWHEIIAGYEVPDLDLDFAVDDWMNSF